MEKFLKHNPVFTVKEINLYREKVGKKTGSSTESIIAYYTKTGKILRVKRGLYTVVHDRSDRDRFEPDPFLLLSKMSDDAIAVLHTALEYHGKAYSVRRDFTYQTMTAAKIFAYRGWMYKPVRPPAPLVHPDRVEYGTVTREIFGVDIKVSGYERCLVDCLDKTKLCGGWEEVWRSLESIEYFDLDIVTEYLYILDNATLTAKVGFFLEQHKESLMVENSYLAKLKEKAPSSPHYMDRSLGGKLFHDWNIIVPEIIADRGWEDVG